VKFLAMFGNVRFLSIDKRVFDVEESKILPLDMDIFGLVV
jgi:hypothetical protein